MFTKLTEWLFGPSYKPSPRYRAGDKVRCIWAPYQHSDEPMVPIEGAIYTIRGDIVWSASAGLVPGTGADCIRLVEIVNPPRKYAEGFSERAYPVHHFEPVEGLRSPRPGV